jgi:hypothetical protein
MKRTLFAVLLVICPVSLLAQTRSHASGKPSDPLLPLAEVTRFRFRKNEMLIRVDDAPKESHFHIKAMLMRPDWDRAQMLEEAASDAMITQHINTTAIRGQQ